VSRPELSILSTTELPQRLKELKYNWESFMLKEQLPPSNLIRNEIWQSWKRCQKHNVDPLQKQSSVNLDEDELLKTINESILYSVSKPIIDELYRKIKNTEHIITLSDQKGRITYLKGGHKLLTQAEHMNFITGADWSEKAAGSNAIGTAIAIEKPIQVLSSEHFCQGVHPWVCSAAPIRDPLTQRILGVIDLTGPSFVAQPHSLTVVQSIAGNIEQTLFKNSSKIFHYLESKYDEIKHKNNNFNVIIFDETLNVVHADRECLQLLNINRWAHLWDIEELRYLKTSLLQNKKQAYEREGVIHALQLKVFAQIIILNNQCIGFMFLFEKIRRNQQSSFKKPHSFADVISQSDIMNRLVQKAAVVADSEVPVLLTGESGTGKEVLARGIHKMSPRCDKPFVAINCGAIPDSLISSELFGYEKGTFTGGHPDGKTGKFEEANEGTLLLDEVSDMSYDLQVHLLRVLQERAVVRLGSSKQIPVNVRVIAATNKDLKKLVKEGLFRSDLYYRLNVVELRLPPLRERKPDIPLLCEYFAENLATKHNKPSPAIDYKVLDFFRKFQWPGNIRELMNVMEHAIIFNDNNSITLNTLPNSILENDFLLETNQKEQPFSLEQKEKEEIIDLMKETKGNLSEVARKLNIARSTLYRKIKRYNL